MINTLDDFVTRFSEIKAMGWVKTHRAGNTGIGKNKVKSCFFVAAFYPFCSFSRIGHITLIKQYHKRLILDYIQKIGIPAADRHTRIHNLGYGVNNRKYLLYFSTGFGHVTGEPMNILHLCAHIKNLRRRRRARFGR